MKIKGVITGVITLSLFFNALSFSPVNALGVAETKIEEIKVGDMPVATEHFSVEVYRGKAYIFGGRTTDSGSSITQDTWIYDIDNNIWTKGASIPGRSPMSGYETTLYKGCVYTLLENEGRYASIFKYNIATNTWSEELLTDKNMFSLGMASLQAYNDKLYIIGGVMDTNSLVYDFNAKTLSDIAKPPREQLNELDIVSYNNKLYCIGDYEPSDENGMSSLVYDILTDTWSYTNAIPELTTYPFVLRQDDKLLTVNQAGKDSYLQVYDLSTDSWEKVNFESSMTAYLNDGFVYNGYLYLLGGKTINSDFSNTLHSDIHKYKISTASLEDSAYDILDNIQSGDYSNIKTLEDVIQDLPPSPEKDDLESILEEIKNNLPEIPDGEEQFPSIIPEGITSNIDIYIKSENTLSVSLDTNSVNFEDFSGVEDLENLNAVQLTVNSSLPYELNAYLPGEIHNAGKDKTLDLGVLNIRENSSQIYQTFTGINQKLTLKDNNPSGNGLTHNIDLKLKGGLAHEADVYKATIKFEVNQK